MLNLLWLLEHVDYPVVKMLWKLCVSFWMIENSLFSVPKKPYDYRHWKIGSCEIQGETELKNQIYEWTHKYLVLKYA